MIPAPSRRHMTMTDDLPEIEKALAAAGIGVSASALAGRERLASLTNRAWRIAAGDGDLVVRLPGPGTEHHIDRRAEAHNLRVAAGLGVGAPVRFVDEASGVLIMGFRRDATVPDAAHLKRPGAIERLGETLRRLHGGPAFKGVMNPFDKIDRYLSAAGLDEAAAAAAFAGLWPAVAALRRAVAFEARALRPCHVDPVPDNMLDTPGGLVLIDWEYAAMSEPLWDLAYAAAEADFERPHKQRLLAAYGMAGVDTVELDLWCALTMAVTVAWCLMQEAVGDDSVTFRAYKERRLAGLAAALNAPGLRQRLEATGGAGRHAVF
jgi:thiamine kinase-like enzyme